MYSRMRERFGAAGLIVAVVALVAALAGGAYAASGALTGKQKKEVKAIAKQYAGKRGPAGPQGPAGANGKDGSNGTNGANGAKGDKGDPGTPGTNGTNGTAGAPGAPGDDGESVDITSLDPGEGGCVDGGAEFSNGTGTAAACNGASGGGGPLGPGETETGVWSVSRPSAGTASVPISFPRLLETAPEVVFVQLTFGPTAEEFTSEEVVDILKDATEYGCPGFVNGVPQADPGKLCIYGNYMVNMTSGGAALTQVHYTEGQQLFKGSPNKPKPNGSFVAAGVGPAGTALKMSCSAGCEGIGVWALTAEE